MECRSEFKHGFTNRGCLYCAILKVYTVSTKKESTSPGISNFSFEIIKMRFSRFSKCLKTTSNSSEQSAELSQK